MTFETYEQTFLNILADIHPATPYDNDAYLNYTKLNWARQQRWLKTGILQQELVDVITNMDHEQTWMVITEPWCGDSAHTLPFVHLLSQLNPLINADYQLRDDPPFLINSYLTNGSKSIPKLIIKENDHVVGIWGPRPIGCQLLFNQLMHDHIDPKQEKIALQEWYNADKGVSFQRELLAILINN